MARTRFLNKRREVQFYLWLQFPDFLLRQHHQCHPLFLPNRETVQRFNLQLTANTPRGDNIDLPTRVKLLVSDAFGSGVTSTKEGGLPTTGGIMDADPRDYDNIVVNANDIHKIVLSYLVHNCFKDTLESFVASTGATQHIENLEGMEKRKNILRFALEGNASKAIELTDELAPGLLEENKDLHFDILSLHFVELVCSRKTDEALSFARSKFSPFGNDQKYIGKLEDFMTLLAFEEPEKSPMFHLLSLEHKQHVAENLNRAILAHTKHPSYSALERLIQQTTIVKQCLSQEVGKDGHQPFSLKDFLRG